MSIESVLATSENTALFNVFQMPFLSEDECRTMTSQILENRYKYPHEGSMQKHTIDTMKFLPEKMNSIVKTLEPTICMLYNFGKTASYKIYSAHAIVYDAQYTGEKELVLHTDDSDITVNITLNTEDLEGTEINFMNTTPFMNDYCLRYLEKTRKKLDLQTQFLRIKPRAGWCILHRGDHPHETDRIWKGRRLTLIIWLKK